MGARTASLLVYDANLVKSTLTKKSVTVHIEGFGQRVVRPEFEVVGRIIGIPQLLLGHAPCHPIRCRSQSATREFVISEQTVVSTDLRGSDPLVSLLGTLAARTEPALALLFWLPGSNVATG